MVCDKQTTCPFVSFVIRTDEKQRNCHFMHFVCFTWENNGIFLLSIGALHMKNGQNGPYLEWDIQTNVTFVKNQNTYFDSLTPLTKISKLNAMH